MTDASPLADRLPAAAGVAARIAYLQLLQFQELSALVTEAPALADKQALGRSAGFALERHELACSFLESRGLDASAQMKRVAAEVDSFATRVVGRDWNERILTVFLTSGILHDFYEAVLPLLDETDRVALEPTIDDEESQQALHEILVAAIDANHGSGDRLAMWGRRLVGDALLACRRVVGLAETHDAEADEALDPIVSELTAEHSRRMNALGLAA